MPPSVFGEWLRRLWFLLNRSRFERALQEEMEAHRSMMGNPPRFGNTLRLREEASDAWGWAWLDALVRDLRFAARGLRRTPAFTLAVVGSLGIGLALTASTVAVANAYLVRSLPYPDAQRLYRVRYAPPGPWEPSGMTGLDWKSVEDVVEFPIAAAGDTFYLRDAGLTVAARGLRASHGFVNGLGVPVMFGRGLVESDFQSGAEPVALIGHSLWRDRFGSDPAVIGRSFVTEPELRPGAPETFRVVGVLQPEFFFGRDSSDRTDLIVPLSARVRVYMAKLREGVPPAVAERRITEAARRAATSPLPADWAGIKLASAHELYVADLRPILIGITVAAGLVLVVVCANVAVLMLLRAMQRQKEVAVRLALGSGRRHIGRMLFAEGALICAAALGIGLALTVFALRSLAPLIELQLGRPAPRGVGAIGVDANVLLLVGVVSLVVALTISAAPLLTTWGRGLSEALRRDGRVGSDGPAMRRVRAGLIAFEIAGALVLLVGCGLMLRSVVGMLHTDFGYEIDGLVRTRIALRARNYPDAAAYRRFFEQFSGRLATLSGGPVVFTTWPPFNETPVQLIETGSTASGIRRPGLNAPATGGGVSAGVIGVSAGYFDMLRIPIRQGRPIAAEDHADSAPVAVISETLAARLWPDGSALGRRVRAVEQTQGGSTPGPWRTVVGIAADVRQTYTDENRYDFYMPMFPASRYGSFYVRSERPVSQLLDSFRSIAAEIDPDAVVNEPKPVPADDRQLAGTRFITWMLSAFAAIAALLATLGIYGVTAYAAQQREKEVAIRIALGASTRSVVALFLKEGGVVLGAGVIVGLAAAGAAARVLRNLVYGGSAFDVSTHVLAGVVIVAAGLLATWWPARCAAARSPIAALNGN